MENVGDDFGDLYADVEIQASSAINGAPDFVRFDEDDTEKLDGLDFGDGSSKSENEEPNVVDNGSDSEDDFNIVLNDEDDQRFPARSGVGVLGGSDGEDGDGMEHGFAGGERGNGVKGGYHLQFSQYKYVWSHSTVFPSNAKANGTAKVASFSPMIARGDWDENGSNQFKGSSSGEVTSTRTIAAPLVAQGGYGFSLPWYRTILDVNIDTFEQKPWKHPGVDLTDFFNFGFNKDTWKNYCNSLEQYRKQMYILNQTPVYHYSKPSQTAEGGLEHEKDGLEPACKQGSIVSSSSRSTGRLELPKGRAIQVEGSTGERQPSMDVRRPRYRDSDVVIHIAVQDSVDDEIDHIDSTESSENGGLKVGDNKDIHCYGSGNENKPCVEKNITLDMSSVLKRSSKPLTTSNPVSMDSDDVGNGKIPDNDTHCSQNINVHVPEGITEVVDALNTPNQKVGRNTCNTDSCMMETELSLDGRVCQSPASSCHGSHSETSQDGGYIDPEKNQNARRKPSSNLLTNLPESTTTEYYLCKNSKNKVRKTKPIDNKDSLRYRSPVRDEQKNRYSRPFCVDELPSRSGNDVASPRSKTVDSLYDRDHSPVGHSRQKERLHDFGSQDDDVSPMSNSEDLYYKHYLSASHKQREDRCDSGSYDDDFSSMSEVEGMHSGVRSSVGLSDKGHSFASCRRRKGQLHDFDSYDREGFSYYREMRNSFNYCSEKFDDNNVQTVYAENSHRKDRRSCRDKMYPHSRNKYFSEKRITRVGNKIMERDWCRHERNLSVEDMDPLTHRESRQLGSKYSYSDKEKDTRWRKKNDKLKFQKGPDNDDLFQNKNTDGFTHENSTRSFRCNERNSLAKKHGRHMRSTRRKVNFYGRGKRFDDSHLDLDSFWSVGVEDEYGRHVDHRSLSSRSYRESHTANGRNDSNDSRLTERHGIDRRQTYPRGYRDNDWFGNRNDVYNSKDGIMDSDDQVHIGRRRSRQQYKALHWPKNELIFNHLDENLYNDEASLSYERDSRHTRIRPKYGSAHAGMPLHEENSQQQRYRRIREGRTDNFINRSSNVLVQGNREQRFLRSRASVDLVVGKGKLKWFFLKCNYFIEPQFSSRKNTSAQSICWKYTLQSSGRCFESGSVMLQPDRFQNMDWKSDEDQGTLKDINGPQRFKSERNQKNKNCSDEFLVTERDEALDLEEGQIIPEETNKDLSIKTKHVAARIIAKRRLGNANAANGNKAADEYHNQQILQTLAKMEKRQERFRESIVLKNEPDKIPKAQVDKMVETDETMQQRPVRKRRWKN